MDRRHPALPRAFDLARWSYNLDFILAPLAIAVLAYAGSDLGGGAIAALLAVGVVAWSLAEYWIHRLAFHGDSILEPMHQMHHALPKAPIGVASWGTFAGFAAVWFLAWCYSDVPRASMFTAGFIAGYLFYCGIHVRMHHGNPARFGRYTRMMWTLHAAHHRGGTGNFGVSSPAWDVVFRTFRPS